MINIYNFVKAVERALISKKQITLNWHETSINPALVKTSDNGGNYHAVVVSTGQSEKTFDDKADNIKPNFLLHSNSTNNIEKTLSSLKNGQTIAVAGGG